MSDGSENASAARMRRLARRTVEVREPDAARKAMQHHLKTLADNLLQSNGAAEKPLPEAAE